MNTIVKNVILITIPAAVSAVASHFITKKIISAKYEAEMELKIREEIKQFKKEYEEKMSAEPKRIPVSHLSKEQLEKAHRIVEKEEERTRIISERRERENSKDIDEEIIEDTSPMEEDIGDDTDSDGEDLYDEDGNLLGDPNDDEDENGSDVVDEDNAEEGPYVISVSDFDAESKYQKSSLKYYEDDKVLANENDYPLDIDEIIGEDSLEHFGDMSGDPTIVYVRNEDLNSVYEVQLVHGSFKHLVGDLK